MQIKLLLSEIVFRIYSTLEHAKDFDIYKFTPSAHLNAHMQIENFPNVIGYVIFKDENSHYFQSVRPLCSWTNPISFEKVILL